jgi:hypothetical protein
MNPLDRTKVNPQPHLRGTAGVPRLHSIYQLWGTTATDYRNQLSKSTQQGEQNPSHPDPAMPGWGICLLPQVIVKWCPHSDRGRRQGTTAGTRNDVLAEK